MNETPKKKILVVEDDPFMIDLLCAELGKTGAELILAKTGSEGVEKFKETSPDLVMLDIILPDQDGFDALRAIRRLPGGPEARVIILSNVAEGANLEKAKQLGVQDYLMKSNYSLAEVLERVKKLL